jgi:hypothetical protein
MHTFSVAKREVCVVFQVLKKCWKLWSLKVELWNCLQEGGIKKNQWRDSRHKGVMSQFAVALLILPVVGQLSGCPLSSFSATFFWSESLSWDYSLGFKVFLRILLDKQPKNMGGGGRVLSRGGWVEVLHQYFIFKYVSWYHLQENLAKSGYMF